jgi:hypothetical protein
VPDSLALVKRNKERAKKKHGGVRDGIPASGGTAMEETQREVADYFRDLERALNEQKEKGTPKGDPAYSGIYTQLARDIFQIGIGRDELREAAKVCGHLSTFELLEQLMKKPIG